jgi:glycosyltransferase involved in cell wall biosynthesis
MSRLLRPDPTLSALTKLSVVIPARDEEGCIASTVEHLHVELRLHDVPHEIIVVDDGSTDRTWQILADLRTRIPEVRPTQNGGAHGFGRAVAHGLNEITGDAVVIMMADESDDCRDVVRYWQILNQGLRGYSWTVIPITWRNRRTGEAKLMLKEMGSRYLFIILYVWLEKYFSRGDYRKQVAMNDQSPTSERRPQFHH